MLCSCSTAMASGWCSRLGCPGRGAEVCRAAFIHGGTRNQAAAGPHCSHRQADLAAYLPAGAVCTQRAMRNKGAAGQGHSSLQHGLPACRAV